MKILRKMIGIVVVVLVILVSNTVSSKADEYESGDYRYEINSDGYTITITQYMADDESVTIPSYIDNYKVTIIGDGAFYNKDANYVILPNTIEKICVCAFRYCSMKEILLSNSVKVIENNAFEDCENLEKIYIPSGVQEIGNEAFVGCDNIISIEVDSANSYFDSRENCNALVETKTNTLLRGCVNTTIPQSVTIIGSGAFAECNNLYNVEIPSNITKIESDAFYNCPDLKKVVVPESVTEMEGSVFSHCEALTSVKLPSSLEKLAYGTFHECTNLEYIELPPNLTSIDKRAFSQCINLKNIEIPESVKEIGEETFYECTSLSLVQFSSNIVTIDSYAFSGCTSLTQIELPGSIKKIGMGAFSYTALTTIKIPSSVEILQKYIFWECSDLQKVEIAEGVSEIPESMFEGCGNLVDVKLPDGIKYIGERAFAQCQNLISITIPYSAIMIESNVFDQHNSMFEIRCYEGSVAYRYAVDNSIKYVVLSIPKIDISQAYVTGVVTKTYDGTPQEQEAINVILNGVALKEDIDYKVAYENNLYPGAAKIIISGIEKYCGTIEITFSIDKQIINIGTNANISVSNIPSSVIYKGTQITFPDLKVTISGIVLEEKKDYKVTYTRNVNVGDMNVIITGVGDYTGSVTKKVRIKPRDISQKSASVSISGIPRIEIYTGKSYTYSKIMVRQKNIILTKGKDYDVKYYNNKSVGIARVVIIGRNNYSGSITKTFNIRIPVGKVYTLGKLKYKVMSFGSDGKGSVVLIGSTNSKYSKNYTSLIVKDVVNIGGAKMTVTAIEDNAFRGYSYLKKVIIGSNVKAIGKNTFYGCKSLENVVIGKNTRRIGDSCFEKCSRLKKIVIYTKYLTKTSVRNRAFNGIYAKATIKVPTKCLKTYKSLMIMRGVSRQAKIVK